jgi:hypothetical protein
MAFRSTSTPYDRISINIYVQEATWPIQTLSVIDIALRPLGDNSSQISSALRCRCFWLRSFYYICYIVRHLAISVHA